MEAKIKFFVTILINRHINSDGEGDDYCSQKYELMMKMETVITMITIALVLA